MHCSLCLFFTSSFKVFGGCFRQAFFHLENKKKVVVTGSIREVVVLHSNHYMGICLGRLSIVCLRQVVVLQWWSFDQVSL